MGRFWRDSSAKNKSIRISIRRMEICNLINAYSVRLNSADSFKWTAEFVQHLDLLSQRMAINLFGAD